MSTRPLPPPEVLRDDPGPWSVVSSVFAQAGRPGKRRPLPPIGLMLSPPPEVGLALAGIDPSSPVAGVGQVTIVAAAREPDLPGAVADPTGTVVAAFTREGRFDVVALLRDDRSVVRWVRGVRAATWSPDGLRLALGGTWGVLLAQAREASPAG